MRPLFCVSFAVSLTAALAQPPPVSDRDQAAETMVNRFFVEALTHGQAYENLRVLTGKFPGRLSGSQSLQGAVNWGQEVLQRDGADRVFTQEVSVSHWERGAPASITLISKGTRRDLAGLALGSSPSTPFGGIRAGVIEVGSLGDVERLGRAAIAGRIVFFNRAMKAEFPRTMDAYADAGDQRNRGPGVAAKYGAVAALTRSLTLAQDDVPHTGSTTYLPEVHPIPAAALGVLSADALSSALAADPQAQVALKIHTKTFRPAASQNVIGEIRGREFPDQIILVGGHLDSWDVTPGAHDDGAGIVQAIEVLRLFRALGVKPRHTLRCVLFTNEENGLAGATRYGELARAGPGRHLFAVETDNGGYAPSGFNLGSTQGTAHLRAERWRPLFEPWGIWRFVRGAGGADVNPLLLQGVTVAGLTPDSQRYFDYHHTPLDSIDKVNPRELHLGAAAIASLVWLVDTQGL
ncbi:MAG: peptidase [Verrucomicrobia bacterium]|nr:peptidase [Verrucomicrobiota bacterium]